MNFYRYKYDNDSREWEIVLDDDEYTITYESASGKYTHWVKSPPKKPVETELQAGDSAALDAFLGGFASA